MTADHLQILNTAVLGDDRVEADGALDKGDTFEDLVEQQFAELHKLLSQFRDETIAYVPRPYPQFVNAYGAYDHLARVKEWAAGGEGGE